jgi:hypothetical protein
MKIRLWGSSIFAAVWKHKIILYHARIPKNSTETGQYPGLPFRRDIKWS